MGYSKLENHWNATHIFEFKHVYALEKIHGTSTHIREQNGQLQFHAGGVNPHQAFVDLFDQPALLAAFAKHREEWKIDPATPIVVYGEGYGGKMQGMSATYGPKLKFVAFEVQIGDKWLDVPVAEKVVLQLGLEFVPYERVPCDIDLLGRLANLVPSVQAVRNGITEPKPREGIVIRPPYEVTLNGGGRVRAKWVADAFRETKSIRKPKELTEDKVTLLNNALAVAEEYGVPMRLNHVLDKLSPPATSIADTGRVVSAFVNDVKAEAKDVIWTKETEKALGRKAAELYKEHLVPRGPEHEFSAEVLSVLQSMPKTPDDDA